MAEIKPFRSVKPICGIIAARDDVFDRAESALTSLYGPFESRSPRFVFNLTSYYEPAMGGGLRRGFLSFEKLMDPSALAAVKIRTNALESEIAAEFACERRIVNLDPGYMTPAALIMATAKDFSHRVPLAGGIYAHLEFLFSRDGIRRLEWTYPDFLQEGYREFFLDARRAYLGQLRREGRPRR